MYKEKVYSDSSVRGEKTQNSKLLFSSDAKADYNKLNGSQKSFVDRELDKMNIKDNIPQEITLRELSLNIFLRQDNEQIIVTKISADGFEDSQANRAAIKRAQSWNN